MHIQADTHLRISVLDYSDIPRNSSCKEMIEYRRSRKSGFVPEDKQGLMRNLSVIEDMCEKGRWCVLWHDRMGSIMYYILLFFFSLKVSSSTIVMCRRRKLAGGK